MRQAQLCRRKAAWELLALLGLSCAVQLEAVVTFGLKSDTGGTVATLSATGDLGLVGLYTEANDIPAQRQALSDLYNATAGQNWYAPAYKQTIYLDAAAAFNATYGTYPGIIPVDFTTFVGTMLLKVPWFTPGFSYCRWWGVECCLTASELTLPTCSGGLQSIGVLALAGAGMVGTFPPLYESLPDLTLLFIANNPELVGTLSNVTESVRANLELFQLSGTSLQNPCATPGPGGRTVSYYGPCISDLFTWNAEQQSASANKQGMICPGLTVNRPATASNLSASLYNNVVSTDPLLYSYQGCTCAAPLVAHYHIDSAGLFQMDCIAVNKRNWIWDLIGPLLSLAVVSLLVAWLVLTYRARLLQAWETRHIKALKRRNAPGTLMQRQGKGMDLFHSGVTLVMSDIEGLAAVQELLAERSLTSSLALHNSTLRSLLPKYCGYEVLTDQDAFIVAFHDPIDAIGWALHVQLALLEAPWPPELLQQPQAKLETCQDGKLLFRGLRIRMAINTGVPAEIIVHSTLKHVEYKGEIMELSRSLLQLPAGGQVLLSDTTFQRIGGRLHEVKLPALQLPRARNSVDGPRGSLEGRSRHTFEGQLRQKVEGQSRQNLDGGLGQSSPGSSRRSSMDSTVKLMEAGMGLKSAASPVPMGVGPTPSPLARGLPPTMEEIVRMEKQKVAHGKRFSLELAPMSPRNRFNLTRQTDASLDAVLALPDDEEGEASITASAAGPTAAEATAATALASILRTSCTIIDMGSFLLSEVRSRPYTADDAALPCIAGEHVRQILPEALVERAASFPPFDRLSQVAPSFFDAPGAQGSNSHYTAVPLAISASPNISPPSTHHLSDDLPNVTFAFASEVGYKEVLRIDKQQALIALGRFKSCVRTSLLLCGGHECQEKEGTFMIAFPQPRAAVEWALALQLALLRLPWGEGLLGLAPTQEERSPVTGQLLFRGLSAKVGIFHGPVVKLCPHSTTGRADYFGTPVNRAARFWSGCNAGQGCPVDLELKLKSDMPPQILVEKSLIEAIGLEWAGLNGNTANGSGPGPAAAASHIAVRNHALLTQRMESDLAASRNSYSLMSPGRMGQHSLKRTTSVTPKVSFGNPRASMDMQLPAVYISDDKGILSPMLIGRNPRRSMDSPRVFARPSSLFSPGPRDSEDGIKSGNVELVKALSGKPLTKDGSAQMIRPRNPQGAADHKSPRRPSQGPEGNQAVQQSSKSMDFSEFQRAMLLAGAKLVARTSSQGEEKKKVIPPPKLEIGTEVKESPAAVPSSLPSLYVKADIYHMGQYSYKGIDQPVDVCQILPSSLTERRNRYADEPVKAGGKVVCLKKDDKFHFSAQVPLPSVFHLPLAAEPPLYINMVRADFQSFSGIPSSNPQVTWA